jgi:succinate-semialdehyde dehydrogenase / glutarate-semialdehyde dehydrogenase
VPEGAKLSVGGRSLGGNFFEPTLLLDVIPNIAVAREETFGPVAPSFGSGGGIFRSFTSAVTRSR